MNTLLSLARPAVMLAAATVFGAAQAHQSSLAELDIIQLTATALQPGAQAGFSWDGTGPTTSEHGSWSTMTDSAVADRSVDGWLVDLSVELDTSEAGSNALSSSAGLQAGGYLDALRRMVSANYATSTSLMGGLVLAPFTEVTVSAHYSLSGFLDGTPCLMAICESGGSFAAISAQRISGPWEPGLEDSAALDLSWSDPAGSASKDGVLTLRLDNDSDQEQAVFDLWIRAAADGQVAPVPEPGEWALMSAGLLALGAARRARTRGKTDA